MKTFSDIFKDKTVIVTGHTGFKGSWASIWLNLLGAKIIGVSDEVKTQPSNFFASGVSNLIEDIRGDLKDPSIIRELILKNKPDFIFHFAAQSLVSKSYINPIDTFSSNFLSTMNILETLRNIDKNVIAIFITSDKVYQNNEWPWGYRESDQLGGDDPYSSSKGICELIIKSYFQSFFKYKNIKIGIGRAGNVIGGGDWNNDRLVPDCVKAWSIEKTVKIRNPFSTRPWQFVLEPISGYFSIASSLQKSNKNNGEAFNFGPNTNENYNVEKVIKVMTSFWKGKKYKIENENNNFVESNLLKLNCDKASLFLNWKPVLNFEKTIEMTIDWYKYFYEQEDKKMYKFSCKQIEDYTKLSKIKKLDWAIS